MRADCNAFAPRALGGFDRPATREALKPKRCGLVRNPGARGSAAVSASDLNAAIDRAAKLLATDPAAAERDIRATLRHAPQDPRAGLILASARRRLGHAREARSILEPLAKAFPRAALTHYELGACLSVLGEPTLAAATLRSIANIST